MLDQDLEIRYWSKKSHIVRFFVVPGAGLEPARPCGHKILSLERLPFRHPGMHRKNLRAGDGDRTRDLLLGKETRYHFATPALRLLRIKRSEGQGFRSEYTVANMPEKIKRGILL